MTVCGKILQTMLVLANKVPRYMYVVSKVHSKNDFSSFLDMRIYCLIGIVIALSVFDLSTYQHSKSGKHLMDLGWIDSHNIFNFFDFPEIQPI